MKKNDCVHTVKDLDRYLPFPKDPVKAIEPLQDRKLFHCLWCHTHENNRIKLNKNMRFLLLEKKSLS